MISVPWPHMSRVATNEPLLVPDQKVAYDHVVEVVQRSSSGIIFLDAPGGSGTGKTFVLNLLLAKIRLSGIAIAVSSSGIAATLLQVGRTVHSAFNLPLNLNYDDSPVCNISKTSGLVRLLINAT